MEVTKYVEPKGWQIIDHNESEGVGTTFTLSWVLGVEGQSSTKGSSIPYEVVPRIKKLMV